MMESDDGVEMELSNGCLEKGPASNGPGSCLNKETTIVSNGTDVSEENEDDASQANGTLEGQLKAQDDNVSEKGVKELPTTSENKASNLLKKAGAVHGNNLKNSNVQRVQKDGSAQNAAVAISKNPKARLSQSLTFPTKSFPTSGLRKSTTDLKQAKVDVSRPKANEADKIARPIARKTISVTAGSTSRLLPINSGLADDGASSEGTQTQSPRTTVHRRSSSGFSFRSEQRAEKRKEYFTKLEEKINAMELEKTNMQAKSKENQEAEIKQLRKSLTFKATPMPTFYQEPSPPKVELKKIPPTRARSPKLGRHKPSSPAASNHSESNKSTQLTESNPNSVKQNGGSAVHAYDGAATPKKTPKKSISQLPSQKPTVNRPEAKSATSKPTKASSTTKPRADKGKVGENEIKPAGVEAVPEKPFEGEKINNIISLGPIEVPAEV